jgi:hypothetical protein
MGIFDKAKAKIAYERESHRMGQEHLKKVAEALPFPKGYMRMTDAEIARWRREQKGGK